MKRPSALLVALSQLLSMEVLSDEANISRHQFERLMERRAESPRYLFSNGCEDIDLNKRSKVKYLYIYHDDSDNCVPVSEINSESSQLKKLVIVKNISDFQENQTITDISIKDSASSLEVNNYTRFYGRDPFVSLNTSLSNIKMEADNLTGSIDVVDHISIEHDIIAGE